MFSNSNIKKLKKRLSSPSGSSRQRSNYKLPPHFSQRQKDYSGGEKLRPPSDGRLIQVARTRPTSCPPALKTAVPANNFFPSTAIGQAITTQGSPTGRGRSICPMTDIRPRSVDSRKAKAPGQSRAVQINSGRT